MDLKHIYYKIYLIRKVEEKIIELFPTDQIKSPVHLSIGQESIPVLVCQYLTHKDMVTNSYRSHASYLAKGGNLNAMMAELFGKSHGCCKGKGGSMHLGQMSIGHVVTSAVVGTTHSIAAGMALAFKMQELNHIVTSFFGDGSTEEGAFYETLNFASLKELPLLMICENNRLAIHTPIEQRWAKFNLIEKAQSFGLFTKHGNSHQLQELDSVIEQSVTYVRQEKKPLLLEIDTYRYMEHVGPLNDHNAPYRDSKTFQKWKDQDPLDFLERQLLSDTIQSIRNQVDQEISNAVQFALQDSNPSDASIYEDVYA